jgi:hypothetical protein
MSLRGVSSDPLEHQVLIGAGLASASILMLQLTQLEIVVTAAGLLASHSSGHERLKLRRASSRSQSRGFLAQEVFVRSLHIAS